MMLSAGTRTSSYRISAWPPGSPVRWSGSPIVGTSRRMFTPGVRVGTMIIEYRRYGSTSGFVRHITMRKSEMLALDENHLWPLMTHSSPSRSARVGEERGVGARPRLGHREAGPQLAGQQRLHPLPLLLVGAADGDELRVARVRRLVAEDARRVDAGTEDLVHQAQLHLAEPAAAHLRRQVGRPQALVLDLLLERRGDGDEALPPLRRAPEVGEGLEGHDLLADEAAHPVELRLELGLGGEVPGHATPSQSAVVATYPGWWNWS